MVNWKWTFTSSIFFVLMVDIIFKQTNYNMTTTKSTLLLAGFIALFAFACNNPGTKETDTNTSDSTTVAPAIKLEKKWETDTVLQTSESVLYDQENQVLYVSNIGNPPPTAKDGDGFIAKVSLDGEILTEKWITGLDAPKGMGIYNGKLYVTNITELVEVDLATASITNRWEVEGAQFLNDVTIDPDGNIYFSDSNTNKIHLVSNGNLSTWLSDSTLGNPNGLLFQGDKIMLATFGSGELKKINLADKSVELINGETPGGDGVESVGEDYLVSSWQGEVYYISASGEKTVLLSTQGKANAADIEFIAEKNLLLVPTFFDNRVVAYELKK